LRRRGIKAAERKKKRYGIRCRGENSEKRKNNRERKKPRGGVKKKQQQHWESNTIKINREKSWEKFGGETNDGGIGSTSPPKRVKGPKGRGR